MHNNSTAGFKIIIIDECRIYYYRYFIKDLKYNRLDKSKCEKIIKQLNNAFSNSHL